MRRRSALMLGLTGGAAGLAALLAATTSGCRGSLASGAAAAAPPPCGPASTWPAWTDFKRALLTAEGRIADPRDGRFHTVSEAQAYALFFALVANDRPAFDAVLAWTVRELADGDLGARLPAWLWGRDDAGHWRVLDRNAASDADLWLVYTLAQAGRLWHAPALRQLADRLGLLLLQRETVQLADLGRQLLPGPVGFVDPHGHTRLNPSYLPLPVLRWLATAEQAQLPGTGAARPWAELLGGAVLLLRRAAPHGLSPDWWLHAPADSPAPQQPLAASEALGGYNAIRVYLWLGLASPQDPDRTALLAHHASVCDVVEQLGDAPLSLDPARPAASQPAPLQAGPRGFAAALLPLARALGRERCAGLLAARLQREAADPQAYYDSALALFAQGHLGGQYRFDADGSLHTPWAATCAATAAAGALNHHGALA
ncbi:MAG: cellulase [Pseudomonadota bacterium]